MIKKVSYPKSRDALRRRGRPMNDRGLIDSAGQEMAEQKRGKGGRPPVNRPRPDKEWFDSRIKELGLTQEAIAAELGKDRSVLNRKIAGTRPVDSADVAGLHRVLRVSAREILKRLGYRVAPEGVPVVGKVMGDGRVSPVTSRKGIILDIAGYPHDAHAYVAETDGTPLSAYDGAAFICRAAPATGMVVPPEAVGRLAIVEADAYPLPMLGTVHKVLSRGTVAFTVFGTAERMSLQKVHRVECVLAIKFP